MAERPCGQYDLDSERVDLGDAQDRLLIDHFPRIHRSLLHLCSAAAHPGGGVTGIPGHNAAREILNDL